MIHPAVPAADDRAVITGIGAITPVGIGREETWRSLLAGRSGVAAAREAAADARLTVGERPGEVRADRVGVVINAAVAGFDTVEHATRQLLGPDRGRLNPYFVASSLTNM